MSGASPLAYPPATFPANLGSVGLTTVNADYLQTTNTTGNDTIGASANDDIDGDGNNMYRLTASAYTGIANQFVLDVSGLISGDTHKVIFTDKSAAGVPYTQKNKIDVISFTPSFTVSTRAAGPAENIQIDTQSVDHPDVSMINYSRGTYITKANGGMQYDCARITFKDRVNVYDGADMQVVLQNNTLTSGVYDEDRIVKFTSNANTFPPLRVNGGPGGPSDISVTIDSSANSETTDAATPTTGVVSLDMGSKIYGLGIDISQIVVAFTDTTDLDLTSVTLDYTRDGRSPTLYTRYKAKAATLTNAGALGVALTDAKLRTAGALADTYTQVKLVGALSGKESAKVDITVADTVTTAAGAKTIAQAAVAGTTEAGKVSPDTALADADLASSGAIPTDAFLADGTTAVTASIAYTASSNTFAVTLSGIAAKINPGSGVAVISESNKTLKITVPNNGAGDNDALNALGVFSIVLDNTILTKTVALANGVVGNGYKLNEALGIASGKLGSGSLAISSLLSANTNNFEDDATAFVADPTFRNRKKLTDAELASGKLNNVFEIANSNDKSYEFTVAYKDAKGIIGVAKGANSVGVMSEGASPITIAATNIITKDLANEMPDTATAKKMNGGKGDVAQISWTAPTYVPGELINYKIWWLSEKDASNSLAGSGGEGEIYNFLYDDAVAKGNVMTIDPSLSAIVPVGENYSGATLDGTENNTDLLDNELTDGSGNWAFWVSATVKKVDGSIVDGQINNKTIALYSTLPGGASDKPDAGNGDLQRRNGKPHNYVSGAPSAPELFKVTGGKDVEALATGESQLPNYKMENRLHVSYYDDKAESNGLEINGAKFAVFRTKDVPYLPAVIPDASFNSALNITSKTIDEGLDLKSIETQNNADVDFVIDYYDDLSGVWRNVGHTGGDKNSPSRHNVYRSTTDPGVNKYATTNHAVSNLKDGESYSVFMKLSNANGGGVTSVGKSALVSSKPNARAFLPGDLAGVPTMSNGRATNADVLGPYWLGSDNIDATNPSKRNDGATVTALLNADDTDNPEAYLNAIHFNNDAMDAGSGNKQDGVGTDAKSLTAPVYAGIDSSVGTGAEQEITLPVASTEGVKDTSYCTIGDHSLTLKYSLTYDISRGLFGESAGIPVQAHRARNAASLNVATGGKPITYLKYQVHTPNSASTDDANLANTAAGALLRAKEFDEFVAHRTGFGNNAALPWHPMYHASLNANAAGVFYGARKLRDISGGTYPSAPNVGGANQITRAMAVQASYKAAGVQVTEQPQKTIQISAPADGKVTIKHYYDASGNPQPLMNGVLYNIKLWAGNENGDSIFKDISYGNFAPRGQIAAPNTPVLQANTTATINGSSKLVLPVRWLDISGDQGAGQFYESYHLTATQTIGGTERLLATTTVTNAADAAPVLGDGLVGGTATTCANVGKLNSATLTGSGATNLTPVYGVPIKLTITGFKTPGPTSKVTTNVTDRGPNGTRVKGAFGIDGGSASAGVDKDISGATTTTFFNLPIGQNNGQNEVQFIETKPSNKKLTINWAGANEAALYTSQFGEAAVQIVGYSVFLYDASLNSSASDYTTTTAVGTASTGLQASTFNTSRRATLIASKNVGHAGGQHTIDFDGLVNGKAYVTRISTTYAYGPLSSRKVTTTEGGYHGKLSTATSVAPIAVNNSTTDFILPDITFDNALASQSGVPAGVPIFGSKAAIGGNELTIDDNGAALIGAQMIQIKPQASGSGANAFAKSLIGDDGNYGGAIAQATYTAVFPGSRNRIITTFNNTALGDDWNSEINYIFAMNAQGTSVAVTNLDTATLGNDVSTLY